MGRNNSEKGNSRVADFSGIDMKAIGNYTKDAVQHFENSIVEKTNYLEKVDSELKKNKDK